MACQTLDDGRNKVAASGLTRLRPVVVASLGRPVFKKPVEAPLSASGAQDCLCQPRTAQRPERPPARLTWDGGQLPIEQPRLA
jgi:hypothetical protein